MNKNIKIYRPKRKYNKPRYAMEIPPMETRTYSTSTITVQVFNNSKKVIYLRQELK